MKKLHAILPLLLLVVASCTTITHKTETQQSLPELGTVGIFEKYLIQDINNVKSITELEDPIRIKVEKVTQTPRAIFQKKDSLAKPKEYLSLEVFDQFLLVEQINQNKQLLGFLKNNPTVKVVSKVVIQYPEGLKNDVLNAEELYLVQNKERTLSLELRNGKTIQTIEFSQGSIVDFDAASFCWGTKKGYKVEIVDMAESHSDCGKNTYKSYQRAKKKTEFSF